MDTDDAPNGGNGTERDGRASGHRAHKRGHREGSISRRPDGRWHGRLMVGFTPEGKPDRRHVYGETRAEVQRKLNELRRRLDQGHLGDPASGRETLGTFLARWLEASRRTLRPSTWKRYEEIVRLHLIPALGRTRLDALRPDALQRLLVARLESGLSPRTVHHIHRVLHTALGQAVRWHYLPANPADAVDPPAVPRVEISPPAPDELARLLDTAWAARDRLAPLWSLAVYDRLRHGELLGLQWSDVDLDRATLAVRRTLAGARRGVPQFGEPKTSRGRRAVTLPSEAVAALRAQRERQERERRRWGSTTPPTAWCSRPVWGRRSWCVMCSAASRPRWPGPACPRATACTTSGTPPPR